MKTYEIAPALCRSSLLKDPDRTMLWRFFDDWRKYISGITIHFRLVGDNLYVLGGPRLIDPEGNSVSAFDQRLPFDLSKDARYFLMKLIDDESLASHLELVDVQGMMMPSDGQYSLCFFPGCAIFSTYSPTWYAYEKITKEGYKPDLFALRAPNCTIFLDDAESAHAEMAQTGHVRQALETWVNATGMHNVSFNDAVVRMTLPSHQQIADCKKQEVAP